MTEKRENIRIRTVVVMSGAFCANMMGAAFASGQEILQFFTAFGYEGIFGLVLCALAFYYTGSRVQTMVFRQQEKMQNPSDIFRFYLGEKGGRFLSIAVMVILVFDCIMMMTGAGAAVEQYDEGKGVYGRLFLVLCVLMTVLFGLKRLVDIIGTAGYVMIFFMGAITVLAVFGAPLDISEGTAAVRALEFTKGASFWLLSALKYIANAILIIVPLWVLCGQRAANLREIHLSAACGAAGWCAVAVFCLIAQLGNIEDLAGTQIPNLVLAQLYTPRLSSVFLLMMEMASFSAITTEFWYLIRLVSKDGTRRYQIVAVAAAVVLLFASGVFSFDKIVYVLYTAGIWVGILFFLAVLAADIRKAGRRLSQ